MQSSGIKTITLLLGLIGAAECRDARISDHHLLMVFPSEVFEELSEEVDQAANDAVLAQLTFPNTEVVVDSPVQTRNDVVIGPGSRLVLENTLELQPKSAGVSDISKPNQHVVIDRSVSTGNNLVIGPGSALTLAPGGSLQIGGTAHTQVVASASWTNTQIIKADEEVNTDETLDELTIATSHDFAAAEWTTSRIVHLSDFFDADAASIPNGYSTPQFLQSINLSAHWDRFFLHHGLHERNVFTHCHHDRLLFCPDKHHGGFDLMACLNEHHDQLSTGCAERLPRRPVAAALFVFSAHIFLLFAIAGMVVIAVQSVAGLFVPLSKRDVDGFRYESLPEDDKEELVVTKETQQRWGGWGRKEVVVRGTPVAGSWARPDGSSASNHLVHLV